MNLFAYLTFFALLGCCSAEPALQNDGTLLTYGFRVQEIKDIAFADLVAHVTGTQPISSDVDRSGFPQITPFSNPRANLIVALPGVGGSLLESLPFTFENLHRTDLEISEVVQTNFTALSTLAKGPKFFIRQTVVDSISESFKAGRCFTLSLSLDKKLAFIFTSKEPSNLPSVLIYWDKNSQELHQTSYILKEVSFDSLTTLSSDNLVVEYEDDRTISVSYKEHKTLFSSAEEMDLNFLMELSMFIQLFNDLPLSEHRDFSLYSIVISSLERLVRDNGAVSDKVICSMALVEASIQRALKALTDAFGERFAAEVVFSGTAIDSPLPLKAVHTQEWLEESFFLNLGNSSNTTNSTVYTLEQLENFHMVLWSLVIIVITALSGSLAIYSMDTGSDTMLYRMGSSGSRHPHSA